MGILAGMLDALMLGSIITTIVVLIDTRKKLAVSQRQVQKLIAVVAGGDTVESVGLFPTQLDVAPIVFTESVRVVIDTLENMADYERSSAFNSTVNQWKHFSLEQINFVLKTLPDHQRAACLHTYAKVQKAIGEG